MDRAYAAAAVGSPPATPGSPSTGYPSAGNPGGGIPATKPGAYWFHMITEELRAVIVGAGLTPDYAVLTQLRDAINALVTAASMPVGSMIYVPATAAPTGWLKANGAAINRAAYPALWTYAQASGNISVNDGAWVPGGFSPGNGTTTFRIPDGRGLVFKGFHDSSGTYESDTGRAIGSYQADALKAHTHTIATGNSGGGGLVGQSTSSAGNLNTGSTGGTDNLVRNIALLAIIKH